jgi:hypothetical protein
VCSLCMPFFFLPSSPLFFLVARLSP